MTTAAFIILAVLLFWLTYSTSVWLDLRRNPTPDHAETDAEHDDAWAEEIVRRHCLQARLEENRKTRSYIEAVRDE